MAEYGKNPALIKRMAEQLKNCKTLQNSILPHISPGEPQSESYLLKRQNLLLNTVISNKSNILENTGEQYFAFQKQWTGLH